MVKKFNAIQTIDTSDSVIKVDYDTKIVEIEKQIPNHDEYIITNGFIKFPSVIFDDLNNVEQGAIKNEEKLKKYQYLI